MYVCSFPREQRTREQSAADENGADGARRRWQRFVNSRFLAACGEKEREKEREECRGLRKVRGERECCWDGSLGRADDKGDCLLIGPSGVVGMFGVETFLRNTFLRALTQLQR